MMGVVSVSLPKLLKKEVDAIVESGRYENKSELIREALRSYLSDKRELRLSAATYLYSNDSISLGKAAEISGFSIEDMKNFLVESGYKLKRYPETLEEAEEADKELKEMLG